MDSPIVLTILLAVLIVLSAVFSGTEAAFIALNKIRLRHLREKKTRGADRVQRLVSRMDELITTILVCNNLVNTALAAIGAVIFVRILGPEWGVLASTIVVTLVLLIFCETTPKIFATDHPESVSFAFRHIMAFLIYVFKPLVMVSTKISAGILRVLRIKRRKRGPLVSEEEIKSMVRLGKELGYYGENERKMLERVFQFDEIDVFEVMTPFDRMVMIDVNFDEDRLADILMEKGHNRIPVYDKKPQNIIGILYVHDLLYLMKNNQLIRMQDLLSAPYFVLPGTKVNNLLKEFQAKKIQIALVRGKNGKILGLVTLEDLIEEIVGELEEFTPI